MNFVRQITKVSLVIILVLVVSGCTKGVSPSQEPLQQQVSQSAIDKEKNIMNNFNTLMQKRDVTIPEIIKFIDENIAAVSQENASNMVIALEKVQSGKLPPLQDKFADSEVVQKVLMKSFQREMTSNSITNIENKEGKDLLLDTYNSGFKVETAEGMYFPVIDYSFYKKYRNAVTQDIASFIDIMAIESDKTPIKDAALTINWVEILKRASTQERFIKDYSNSAKAEDMRQLLKRYTAFALYGANNTPLFSYDTNQMVTAAKNAYLGTIFDVNSGSFSKVMNGYLAVLKKNDYKLTSEVQEYRNKASEEIK
ncbi:MAG: hypothetical protein K0R55_1406 [Sporomusa sp.]|nr:hypothetical protein [Sporomusa sp.]